ncbi:putative MFS multidrug resistance transporter [Rosellinia necatrix]|uniref:Putative MFS multidrug resistance transporter n=1 Tax=Rosellinia necatrix TaxID=77044 RepID=A0A1S7UMU1_ROSNE|nr:putative MFS multidrug resistance transporter [Rosellinia necatrix]
MSSDPEKLEELFPVARPSIQRRRSSDVGTTTTAEKKSVDGDDPVSPTAISPPPAAYGGVSDEKDGDGGPLGPVRSTASSARPRRAIPIPRESRRGLLPWLSLVPEVDNPYHYDNGVKWMLTIFVAAAAGAAPMGSAIFYPSLNEIAADLHVSATVVNLSVAVYMLSMSVFPLWWSSFSETLGRRSIYLVSFALNAAFTVGSGLSRNIAQLIILRLLAGGAAASVQAVGAGTIADVWETRERGRAMGIFYLGPLAGPLLAPVIGGALTAAFGWRSTMYFLAVYGAVIFVLVLFGVPETLPRARQEQQQAAVIATAPPEGEERNNDGASGAAALSRISTRRSVVQARTRTVGRVLKRVFVDPLSILGFLRFPAVALIVSYAAITFGSLYVLNICIQAAFSAPPYSFPPLIVGALYLPSSVGYVLASLLGGPWLDRIMEREARRAGRYDSRGRLVFYPEDRVRENAWVSASLYPGALVWFGWAAATHRHWAVPSVANFFFGAGSMLVFSMATTMLTEFMPRRASSGVALNNFARNILSATGAVVGQPLIDVIGIGWLATAIALIAWVAGNLALFLLRRNSQKWRKAMNEQLN